VMLVELVWADTETVPTKPLMLARLMLVALLDPALRVRLGLAGTMLKSTPATLTSVEAERPGEVPVTLITAFPVWVLVLTVNVTFCLPAVVKVTDDGVSVVEKPQAHPLSVAVSVTVPTKLPTLVTVIVEFADDDAGMVRVCGLAEIENPWTTTVTVVALAVGVPGGPLTVTMYVPELELSAVTFRMENAATHWLQGGTLTVDGFKVAKGVLDPEGVTVAVRGRGPEKRLNVFTVMLDIPDFPGSIVTVVGFELSLNAGETPDNRQAVSACSSHPEYECDGSFAWSGSQYTKPWRSISVLRGLDCCASWYGSQTVPCPQYPAAFQSWSNSTWIECMQLVLFVTVHAE
jgi:hypothetical protein